MKFIFYRDLKKRSLFKRFEVKRLLVNSVVKSTIFSKPIRSVIFNYSVICYPKYSSRIAFKNRCFLTARGRSIRLIGSNSPLSRHVFDKKSSYGLIFPFQRSSW